MLLQLRDFIQREKHVSRQQVARFLQMDEGALQPLLDFLVKKGIIKLMDDNAPCKSQCRGCSSNIIYYVFVQIKESLCYN